MRKEDGEKAKYTARDTSEILEFTGIGLIDKLYNLISINYGPISMKPMKFTIKDDQNEPVFTLTSTMFQLKNFIEQRCDKAFASTFLKPYYEI